MRAVFLKNDVVRLVVLVLSDVPTLTRAMNDSSLTRFISRGIHPMTESKEEEWIHSLYGNRANLTLGICLHDEDLIGTIGLHNIDHRNQNACLGIIIFTDTHHNKGIGTSSVSLLLSHAFNTPNLRAVNLNVFDNNHRAIRCYEKCGFKEIGRLP